MKTISHEHSTNLRKAWMAAIRKSGELSSYDRVIILGKPIADELLIAADSVEDIEFYEMSCEAILAAAERAAASVASCAVGVA